MKNIILIGIMLLSITSCITQKKCSERYPCIKSSDTTTSKIVTVERHDTIFEFKADSSNLQALIDCSEGKARLTQILAYTQGKTVRIPIIQMRHDTLIVDCRVDSSHVAVSYFEKHTTEFTKIRNQAVQVEFKQTSFQAFLMWAGIIAMSIIVGFVLIKFVIPLIIKAIKPI